ncbi:hypothetical protein LAUMK35_01074 [Mycobacterium pseudokansasii]|nr:hypothetical protein LAUMK35_01074 [Mycobacterium pseudokansasii]VAZ90638.1 hypothetical protein LAUMK21_01074 [Mycobacterium pseudokansasii]
MPYGPPVTQDDKAVTRIPFGGSSPLCVSPNLRRCCHADSCSPGTTGNFGPDWSFWPNRFLGSADPAVIGHRTGTHRTISPEETWQAVQPSRSAAGITPVADITWLDSLGIPAVQAVRPASLTVSVSQGKATSYRAAHVNVPERELAAGPAEHPPTLS